MDDNLDEAFIGNMNILCENWDTKNTHLNPNNLRNGKRTRADLEHATPDRSADQVLSRYLRYQLSYSYTTVKLVGTRQKSQEQKSKRILEIAEPLPPGFELLARTVYWFVTKEEVAISVPPRFLWKTKAQVTDASGTVYYLNEIDFKPDKECAVRFTFPDGTITKIRSVPKRRTNSNKKARTWNKNEFEVEEVAIGDNFEPVSDGGHDPSSRTEDAQAPIVLTNDTQISATEPLIVNFILLVPSDAKYIQLVEDALVPIGFKKEVESADRQSLYSLHTLNKSRHVLIFPYGPMERVVQLSDYLLSACEVILLVDNEQSAGLQLENDCFMSIKKIHSVNAVQENIWHLLAKTTLFKEIALDYSMLAPSVSRLFAISELNGILGGVTCKNPFDRSSILADFFLQWIMSPSVAKYAQQNIYLCFKFAPDTRSFSSYAKKVLLVLNIPCGDIEPVVACGSVLVYVRCPSYIVWHLLLRGEGVFASLQDCSLMEIYECCVCDVENSSLLPANEEFADELTYLMEQMMSDGIEEQQKKTTFRLAARADVVEGVANRKKVHRKSFNK